MRSGGSAAAPWIHLVLHECSSLGQKAPKWKFPVMFSRRKIALVLTLFPLYAITRSPPVFRRNKIKLNNVDLILHQTFKRWNLTGLLIYSSLYVCLYGSFAVIQSPPYCAGIIVSKIRAETLPKTSHFENILNLLFAIF